MGNQSLFSLIKTGKIKKSEVQDVESRGDAARVISEIGKLQSEISEMDAKMNMEIQKILSGYSEKAFPLAQKINQLRAGVVDFAQKKREELTSEGPNPFLGTGWIKYIPGKVRVTVTDDEEAVKELESRGLGGFVKHEKIVNKAAIHALPDSFPENLEFTSVTRTKEKIEITPQKTNLPI